jgi:reactive intermediate/imine deaminase
MHRLLNPILLASSVLAASNALADDITRLPPPGALGNVPFSEAVIYDDVIYLSGQLGVDPETGKLVEGGIGAETRQTLENIGATLERAGASMNDVLKCTVFLADIAEWADMNKVYVTFFDGKPARSAMGTGNGIAMGARVEIECLAAAPDDDDDEEAHSEHHADGDHDAQHDDGHEEHHTDGDHASHHDGDHAEHDDAEHDSHHGDEHEEHHADGDHDAQHDDGHEEHHTDGDHATHHDGDHDDAEHDSHHGDEHAEHADEPGTDGSVSDEATQKDDSDDESDN